MPLVRQEILKEILTNLENDKSIWKQGWVPSGYPISAYTGNRYRGQNSLRLMIEVMNQGYIDNRWLTFKQMEDMGLRFKRGDKGEILAKGRGVEIEYFQFYDKKNKAQFNPKELEGLSEIEKREYTRKNVRMIKKRYTLYNCSLIDGMEGVKIGEPLTFSNASLEDLIKFWSSNESKITYKGDEAYYDLDKDEIFIPEKNKFLSDHEYYSTTLHEMAHSTGHKNRLNRVMGESRDSDEYAIEELRAEISSIFLENMTNVKASRKNLKNQSAYIKFWTNLIKENPDALFTAIADSEKICTYIENKYLQMLKTTTPYSIRELDGGDNNKFYTVYTLSEDLEPKLLLSKTFKEEEEAVKEVEEKFGKMYRRISFYSMSSIYKSAMDIEGELKKNTEENTTIRELPDSVKSFLEERGRKDKFLDLGDETTGKLSIDPFKGDKRKNKGKELILER